MSRESTSSRIVANQLTAIIIKLGCYHRALRAHLVITNPAADHEIVCCPVWAKLKLPVVDVAGQKWICMSYPGR